MADATAGGFDDGLTYERLMGRWSRKVGAAFLEWCGASTGLEWLDVGCGNGAFTEQILSLAAPKSVTGIDPSQGQIAFAEAKHTAATYHVGDALALPFNDQTFDVSVMALAIAFVQDAQKAVDEMARVTKPGGLVATYMWDLPNGGVHLSPISRTLREMGLRGSSPPSGEASQLENLEALWRAAGLRDVETTTLSIDVHFTSFDDFRASNLVLQGPLGEVLKTLSDRQMSELEDRLRQTLPIAGDGSITYGAHANAVKGRCAGFAPTSLS
jgi:ubiquinone/menaquinone biosynthesis C-methylase UbiE